MSARVEGQHRRPDRSAAPLRDERAPSAKVVAFVVALLVFLYIIRSILLPFVLAAILAFVCVPVIDWAQQRTGLPRWAVASGVLVVLLAVVAGAGFLATPPLVDEITSVTNNLQGSVQDLLEKLIGDRSYTIMGTTVSASDIASYTASSLKNWLGQGTRLLEIATVGFSWIFGGLMAVVLLGYFLLDGPRLGAGLFWLVPPRKRPFAHQVWNELGPVLRRYFVGVALVVIYASTAAYIGLGLFLGLKHALVLALLTGFLEIIPLVGPAASAVIGGLVAVQEAASAGGIIAYVIYATALRVSIDQFFGPIVLGRAGRVPPVLIIFCFLAGGLVFGVVGVVLAVPLALTVRITLRVLYDEQEAPYRSWRTDGS